MINKTQANTAKSMIVTSKDLPLSCPLPNQATWNSHPRVYLPIEKNSTATCPYCGTKYSLQK